MPVEISQPPNPNALKFTVGREVGGPKTFAAGSDTEDPAAAELLALPGVTSVFMTADFVTVSKAPDASWEDIVASATQVLETHFG